MLQTINHTLSKLTFALGFFSLSAAASAVVAPNFLTDPGFEDGYAEAGEAYTDNTLAPVSSGSPWTRTIGTCDAWAGGPRNTIGYGAWGGLANGLPAVPNEGGQFVACGGWYPPGERITQQVTGAIPGQEYKLSFWYSHAGVEGLTPLNMMASAGVWINLTFLGSTQPLPYLGPGKQEWQKAEFLYTPTSSSFFFTIGYHGTNTPDYGYIAFDGVAVAEAVPLSALTVIAEVTNDDSGTSTLNDLGITSTAGALAFDAGVTAGSVKTYSASPLTIAPGTYLLSATDLTDYTETSWSCSSTSGLPLTISEIFSEGLVQSNVTLANGDDATCTVTYDDIPAPACSALTGEVNAAMAPIAKLKNGSRFFMASSDLSTGAGHLRAYTIGSNGLPASTASWDAYTAMSTQNQRSTRLYSTAADGSKVLFSALDAAAFGADGVPSNATIIADLGSASLAAISPGSNLVTLENKVDVRRYLSDATYKRFFADTIATRSDADNATNPKLVFTSSNDGFLYAFKQGNGSLYWAWTPRSLTQERRNAASFPTQYLMQGVTDILDIKSGSTYASYVVGSYRNGLGQFVLKLNTDGSLNSIVWDTDHKGVNALADSAPNQGKRAYFSDASGNRYMAYLITTSLGDSVLHIRSIADTSVHYQITLGFTATSTPFVMPQMKGGPTALSLYLGDSTGNIYAAPLLTSTGNSVGSLNSESAFITAFSQTAVAAMHSADSSPVRFIGVSRARATSTVYLRAQSDDRLTLFTYQRGNPNANANARVASGWKRSWSSYLEGAGTWADVNGTSTLTQDNAIASLPAGAKISGEAYVVADSLVLPVTHAAAANSCSGDAYYYFYRMSDGRIPTKTFYQVSDSAAITAPVSLGKGTAQRLHVADHPGSNKLIGMGMADQNTGASTGLGASFYIVDPVKTGLRSWKILK